MKTKQKYKPRKLRLPPGISKRWWGEIRREAERGTEVILCLYPGSVEVNFNSYGFLNVACFAAEKHAREFCRINGLVIKEEA